MSRLSDFELEQLIQDVQTADRMMPYVVPKHEAMSPRMGRLLQESRELRDQAAEREHMAALESGG